jgi:hypothetical protein
MKSNVRISRLVFAALCIGLGCSASNGDKPPVFVAPEAGADGSMPQDGGDSSAGSGGTTIDPEAGQKDYYDPPFCPKHDENLDQDKDGYTGKDGDCNDCEATINPGAYDVLNHWDDDCNGTVDDDAGGCDEGLSVDSTDPMDAVRALGLCRTAEDDAGVKTWGVLSARYVYPDGSTASKSPKSYYNCVGLGGEGQPPNALSHGVLPKFGNAIVPREGSSIVALSSGVAREGVNGASPGGALMCTRSSMPPGFPTPSTNCPNQDIDSGTDALDGIALEVKVRVPTNAKGFSYDFDFYTYEFPGWVCNVYNDYFVALLLPHHASSGPNDNISFDSKNNPVSVNNAWLEVCAPGTYNGKAFACPLSTAELAGTGFDASGATGWLQTAAKVVPGEEITLRFAVWDSVDESADATVLLDNFQWSLEEPQPGTLRPPK